MRPVLLLVDLQTDFLNSTGLQPAPEQLVFKAARVLQTCRAQRIPVVHVWTTLHRDNDLRLPHWRKADRWLCVAGTSGHKTPELLQPLEGEKVVHKTGFNGFISGELDAILKRRDCDTVIVAGIHLHTCVRTVVAESLERGLQVFVVEDAVGSNDPVYAAATRRWLAERGVEFIGSGEIAVFSQSGGASRMVHRSPRDSSQVLFEVPMASRDEIATATRAAQQALQPWGRTTLDSRCVILEKLCAGLDAVALDLARQMALEIGKPISHGLEEVHRAAANIRDVIQRATTFKSHKREPAGTIRHRPVGVIALISPWNNPVAIPLGKIAPALVYGNAVVWKPAPAATRISEVILKLIQEAGIPEDVLRVLSGNHATAQWLASDENVNVVTLTGSAHAGHAIQEICARRFLPLQAELSGNNAAIVWDDADMPLAAWEITRGAFGFAGQRCTANRRVIVSASRFEDLWRELKEAAERLNWGDPLEKATDIGPVIHTSKREEQAVAIDGARQSGAAQRVDLLFETRTREAWVQTGAYAQPAMVCCDDAKHPLVQEETMSPLLVVQRAEDFDHALSLCNGVRHGLAASLFSHSPDRQSEFLLAAQAGILKLNAATTGVDVSLPFGGWKMSGLGPPEHGEADPLFYTRTQTVYE